MLTCITTWVLSRANKAESGGIFKILSFSFNVYSIPTVLFTVIFQEITLANALLPWLSRTQK